jgi:hypothetical protein
MVMLMLLREDKLRLYGDSSYKDRTDNNDKDYEGNDDFFALNYTSPDSQQTKLQKQLAKLFKQSNIGSEKNIYD